jgi:hypothetical protein
MQFVWDKIEPGINNNLREWVGSRVGLDELDERKISCLCKISK